MNDIDAGAVVVRRAARRPAPPMPAGDLAVPPPPVLPAAAASRWTQLLMAIPMLSGTVATAFLFAGREGGVYSYVIGGVFGISSLGMLATSFSGGGAGRQKRLDVAAARSDYLRQLAALRERARANARAQRAGLLHRHPAPTELWSMVDSFRLWERRVGDGDFGVVRIGSGTQSLATPLVAPSTGITEDVEPASAAALRAFLATHSVVGDLPVSVALTGFTRVYVRDAVDAARAMVRAILAQLCVFHAPNDLIVAACVSRERSAHWEYLKWLPHSAHPTRRDALGPVRLVTDRVVDLETLLGPLVTRRPRVSSSPTPAGGGAAGTGAAAFGLPASIGGGPGAATLVAGGFGAVGGSASGVSPLPYQGGRTGPEPGGPLLVVVLDGGDATGSEHLLAAGGLAGVCLIDLDNPPPRLPARASIVLSIDPMGGLHTGAGQVGRADALALAAATALARQLAPCRLAGDSSGGEAAGGEGEIAAGVVDVNFAALLGIGDPAALDLRRAWAPRPVRDQLRVPIGVGTSGTPVVLDLKESAQDGMGPHGLLIGATGSGKSELLRTLVLGLAASHDSEALNFVLVDFKGGATFASLDRLPHTAAVITNLADELVLVDRMTDALNGELVRRQNLLRAAGNLASRRDYERARAAGAVGPDGLPPVPLPVLLIVCDEFSELLSAKPEFIDLFVAIGRLGRSLGVHLLLASQRLEEGRLRGLDTHLSYRIGLRTFSAMESRAVLGVPDAYELPRAPGHGYLKFGTEPLIRFRAAYVSGPYERAVAASKAPEPVRGGRDWRVLPFTASPLHLPETAPDSSGVTAPGRAAAPAGGAAAGRETPDGGGSGGARMGTAETGAAPSLLDLVADALHGAGTPAHQVWLPPLGAHPHLDELLGAVIVEPHRGLTVDDRSLHGSLRVPVALIDRPYDQRRDPMWLSLDASAGHVVIVGGPQSGKSTLVRSLICGLALTHTPREVTCYCLDFGGGVLAALRGLPHVGAVVARLAPEAVRRTVGEVGTVLTDRERAFAAAGVDSIATFRRRIASADGASVDGTDPYGDIFLVVDGWATLRGEYEDLEPMITDIATRGLSYGVHIVVTASRWTDLRPALRDLLGSRLELRLGDPADSQVSRRAAVTVPEGSPGRGITGEGLHFLAASPTIAGLSADELVTAVRAEWPGPGAPAVRELPALVPYDQLHVGPVEKDPLVLPIGIGETDLRPVAFDFAAEPHLFVFGDGGSGKSAFLRALAASIARRFDPEQARIVLIDYRRSMLGEITTEHLIGFGNAAGHATDLVESVAAYMAERMPGPDVTPAQLRARSWWHGPECFVLVDDYDLVATGGANPLASLLEYLPQAHDVGLHLVVARRTGGATRALFEPVLARLKELGTPGLIMSGDRDEGVLLGQVRPQPMPPGRARLVTRRDGTRLIQLAFQPPSS